MQISQNLKLKQSQSLVMTPQLQQAIKLLQLTNLELCDLVNKELEEKRIIWHKNLAKDMYIYEALNVLSELKLKVPQNILRN